MMFQKFMCYLTQVTLMCTNMCSIKWDPTWPGPMRNLWAMIRKPYVRLSKMTVKNWKSAKRAFLGGFLTFWVNLIRRIRILQKFWLLDNFYPRYEPSKLQNDQKSEKMDQKSEFDFIMFLGNSTTENTNLKMNNF
jgi:hypothetical protein